MNHVTCVEMMRVGVLRVMHHVTVCVCAFVRARVCVCVQYRRSSIHFDR